MEFYKLTDFQLYSIINSRHLDKESKASAQKELNRRSLSEEELNKLQDQLKEKQDNEQPVFMGLSQNVVYFVVAVVAFFLLKQCNHL